MIPPPRRLGPVLVGLVLSIAAACAPAAPAGAQGPGAIIAAAPDGVARFSFASREGVCGWADGVGYRDPADADRDFTFFSGRGARSDERSCTAGPLVVDLAVRGGRVAGVSVRVGVGGAIPAGRLTDLGMVPAAEAARYLLGIAEAGETEDSDRAMLAAVLAADVDLGADLLRIGRDARADEGTREQAVFWVALLGPRSAVRDLHALVRDPEVDADVRGHAIFALSQTRHPEDATFLRDLYPTLQSEDLKEKTIFAVSQLRDQGRARWLMDIAANERESAQMREKAIFWAAEIDTPLAELDALYARLSERALKEQVIFAYSRRNDPDATARLLTLARGDADPELREKAIFWLGQAAGREITRDLAGLAQDDNQQRKVQEQAVFALSQRPRDEGVPALIEIARAHRDPELRKTALFWLGQSRDPRALDLFQEILGR